MDGLGAVAITHFCCNGSVGMTFSVIKMQSQFPWPNIPCRLMMSIFQECSHVSHEGIFCETRTVFEEIDVVKVIWVKEQDKHSCPDADRSSDRLWNFHMESY
jgi:hypothetical protein